MSCDLNVRDQLTAAQRKALKAQLDALEAKIKARTIAVKIDKATGAVALVGIKPEDRGSLTDACIVRTLTRDGGFEIRSMILAAEQEAGRKIELHHHHGRHSHDGGKTWHEGH